MAHSRAESLRKARRSVKREDARSKFRELNLQREKEMQQKESPEEII
jgi:hypothetical protein